MSRRNVLSAVVLATMLIRPAVHPPTATAQDVPWPPEVVEAMVTLVAERLDAPTEEIVVEWGPYRGLPVHPEASVELRGSGARGYWVARAGRADGGSASVRIRAGRNSIRSIAARNVARGASLTAADITTESRLVWGALLPDSSSVREGWVAQRALSSGDELVTPAVRPPLAVVSGRPVEIRWGRGAVRITMAGTSGGSAYVGERVTVRTGSGSRLEGVVEATGIVDVSTRGVVFSGGGR